MNPRATLGLCLVLSVVTLLASCNTHRLAREPVAHTTTGSDAGPTVLRSALESFGLSVTDYDALARECGVDARTGTSIDDLERAANRRGLQASQVIETTENVVRAEGVMPAIAVVDGAKSLDFWLLWRRDRGRVVVMDPRRGVVRLSIEAVQKALHLHEMDVPASPEAMASSVMVSRNGGLVHVRGAVVVKLSH